MTQLSAMPNAVVYGCAGTQLTADERQFFADAQPFGFILFGRNCQNPDQLRRLVTNLRSAVGRADAPVLIDQEGGRVARLRPPHWPELPAAGRIGALPTLVARRAAWLHGRLLADLLAPMGIDVNCTPVADLPVPGAHDVIGDRAFGGDVDLVATLARAQAIGLRDGGVLPVVKHLPGHGRARSDSHKELPVVDTALDVLQATDFAPFRALADLPLGMVAHVVFTAVDATAPASISPTVMQQVVRGDIGFNGLLFSDDLSMQALAGSIAERARAVLVAGCDIALHCNGQLDQMRAVAEIVGAMQPASWNRWQAAKAWAAQAAKADFDPGVARAELAELLEQSVDG